MREQTLKVNCDNCGSALSYNCIDKKYEYSVPVDENTLREEIFDFCNDHCRDIYLYNKFKKPLYYHDHIIGRKDREPEYFLWNGRIYYDYPYQERIPAEILKVFRTDDKYNGHDAVNSLILILKDFKRGSIHVKGIHQYVYTNSNKENIYDSRFDLNGSLLLDLLETLDGLNNLDLYLKDLPEF